MPQAYNAEIIRVYTRDGHNQNVADMSPNISGPDYKFDLIVEAESGDKRENNGAPYTISISAFNITTGTPATAISAAFSQTFSENFRTDIVPTPPPGTPDPVNAANPPEFKWPRYRQKFTIQLTAAEAANAAGNVFQYTVVLRTPPNVGDPILSIAQSPLFILVAE